MSEDFEVPDWEAVRSGSIPWSFDELMAAAEHMDHLIDTPHDDWDRRRRGLVLEEEDGSLTRMVFNPDMMENQIMLWLAARMKHLDQTTRLSHLYRFMEIRAFMSKHMNRLQAEVLIRDDQEGDPDKAEISDGVFHVLAKASYDGVRMEGDGEPVRTFDVDRVFAEAKRLMDEAKGE